eukprot:2513487-Amphidinium_carterae.1
MSSLIDSAATFQSRCQEIGMPDGVAEQLRLCKWDTYANLAFATIFASTGQEYNYFVQEILTPICG